MAVKGKNTRLLVNQWDFSGVSNSLEVALNVPNEECTVFTSTGKEYLAMSTEGTITQNGYFDDAAAGTFESSMQSALASSTGLYVAALFGTDVDDCPAYVAPATNINNLTISSPANGLMTVQGEWYQGNGILRGTRIFGGSVTGTGLTTPIVDLGAAGSTGGKAWLFVQSITGTATNAVVRVVGNNSTPPVWTSPTTEGTFTFSTVGAYEIALTGTIFRHLRLNVFDMGGATGFTFVCIVAVDGVTY